MEWGLARISSLELTEWAAYERAYGPINDRWRDDVLAMIHEALQQIMRLQGAAHFTSEKRKNNPVPEPKKIPRPWNLYGDVEEEKLEDPTDNIPDGFAIREDENKREEIPDDFFDDDDEYGD